MRYSEGMEDLKTDLYVALRTAPASVKQRYVSKRGPVDGDAATHELVQIVFKVLEKYTVEPKDLPRPVAHKTH